MFNFLKIHTLLIILFPLFLFSNYPEKNISIIIPFSKGGSTDRMVRNMLPFLKNLFNQNINIINKGGKGTLEGIDYFFSKPGDGYQILATTFSPYIPSIILSNESSYKIEDFEIINLQWFDYDFISVHKNSDIDTLMELINKLKTSTSKRPYKVSTLYQASGHLIVKLLMDIFEIPNENIEFVFYKGGQKARESLANKEVDFMVISAQGSEKYREFIKPLAINKEKRTTRWDAPTINEAIKSTKKTLPIVKGSMRGFAVSKTFKKNYPDRFKNIIAIFEKTLSQKSLQKVLKRKNIGYIWLGSTTSNKIFEETFKTFKTYNSLLK